MKQKTYSDFGEDVWVLNTLNNKRQGFFLDVGCIHPFIRNNTALLELKNDWKGICIGLEDIESLRDNGKITEEEERKWRGFDWSYRTNTNFFLKNPEQVDYESIFNTLRFPRTIDYLSLKISLPYNTVQFLKMIPFDSYRFSTITLSSNTDVISFDDIQNYSDYIQSFGYTIKKTINRSEIFYEVS